MSFRLLPLFLLVGLVLFAGCGGAALAQEPPTDPVPADVGEPAPDAESAPSVVSDEPPLRRLDEVTEPPAAAPSTGHTAPAAPAAPPAPAVQPEDDRPQVRSERGEIVRIGSDALLGRDEEANEVVAIFGSVVADGRVRGSAVAVFGDNTVNTGSAQAVAVFGTVTVNGHVHGEVVAVMGNVQLGPNAIVEGEVVSIGGRVDQAPGSRVNGGIQQVGPFPVVVDGMEGLRAWFQQCLLLARPLAFDTRVLWAWGVAAVFLAFYLFLALVFSRSLTTCAETLERQPGLTLVTTIIAAFLVPILTVLLSFIGVGLLLIPLLMLAGLYGKAAFLTWLGRRITVPMGTQHALPAVLVGGLILLLLYTLPFLGFVIMKLTSALGLGMVLQAIIIANRTTPAPTVPVPPPATPPAMPGAVPATATVQPTVASGFGAAAEPAPTPIAAPPAAGIPPPLVTRPVPEPTPATPAAPSYSVPPPVSAPSTVPPLPTAALPRAGFWLRLGASLLDVVLVAIILGMVDLEDYLPVFFAAYCVVLWALRGTTIGGVICGLKLVRMDERKVDWAVAVVRGLGGFLSLVVLGLGFIWVVFDRERQSWHDKIAGTTIVRVPRGNSLI